MNPKQVTHVVYHANCWDGFTAAWAAWTLLGDQAEYIPAKYGEEPPELPLSAHVAIVDFSYPRQMLEALLKRIASLVILDHHKTAAADLEGFPGAMFDMKHSGAWLAWKFFGDGAPVPAIVEYVQDRDLWRFELPDSREINAWIQSWPHDFLTWDRIGCLLMTEKYRAVEEGSAILRTQKKAVETMADAHMFREIDRQTVPVVNATIYFSDVGDALCKIFPDAPFAAYYLDRADGKRQWGLRSRGDFDVSEVARKYGGGGHPGAAGFTEDYPEQKIRLHFIDRAKESR